MIRSVLIFLALALAGCTEMQHQSESRALELTLNAYANAVRWGDTQQMLAFVDPEMLKTHPLSELDLQRYKQVRFVSYLEQPAMPAGAHEVKQIVKIAVLNVNTQTEREIIDHQLWRYDEATKHWHIVSGLPDITQSRN